MSPFLKAHLLSLETWVRGLFAAFLSGASTSLLSALGVSGAAELGVSIPRLTFKQMGVIALVGGIVGLAAYLKQSPIPSEPEPFDRLRTQEENRKIGESGKSENGIVLLLACLLPLFLTGCGDGPKVEVAPASAAGSTVADPSALSSGSKDKSEAFWKAMKGDLAAARQFLASPAAKANAPIFARAVWRLSLAGARAAEVDLAPVAQVGVPVCDVVISLTGAAPAITSTQIDAVLAGTGSNDSLAAYNPFLTLAGPVLDWITEACGSDPEGVLLAKFYLRTIATEGKLALTPYLPGARLWRGDCYAEEWAEDRSGNRPSPIANRQIRKWGHA